MIFFLFSIFNNLSVIPLKPCTCVIKTALVFLLIFLHISSSSVHKVFGLISTKTGLNLFWITEAISEIQVNGGTITSPLTYKIFTAYKVIKFAEDPELTNIL